MNHETAVTRRPIDPWIYTDRMVCADSYFASAETAWVPADNGTRLFGVVKTSPQSFPMKYLSEKPITKGDDHFSMMCKSEDDIKDMVALLWVELERRYLIANTGSQYLDRQYTASVSEESVMWPKTWSQK